MAEGISHSHTSPVYVGEGKAVSPKPDSAYNKKMQEIFDVVAPEMQAERQEAAEAQGAITFETAKLLESKSTAWRRYKEHKSLSRFFRELDVEWRGRELPHKLDRIMIFSLLETTSALMDLTSDVIANKTFLQKDRQTLFQISNPAWKKWDVVFDKESGNREAIEAGWERLTDTAIGMFSNKSAQETTNRKDYAFISPLSNTLSKIGSVMMSFWQPSWGDRQWYHKLLNSITNPSTIESGFRAVGAIPVGGAAIEKVYKGLNTLLRKESTLIPAGFDVAASMFAAKAKYMKIAKKVTAS